MNTTTLDIRGYINERRMSAFQWALVILCFLIVAVDGMDVAIMGFIAPAITTELGISKAAFGIVMGAAPIGLAIGAIVGGSFSDWLGRRKVLLASVTGFGALTLLVAQADSLNAMVTLRLATGLCLGAAMPNSTTLVAEYVPERSRGFVIATMFTGFNLGSALIGFIAASLIPQFGWRSVPLFGGLLPIVMLPFLFAFLPESARFMAVRGISAEHIRKVLGRVCRADLSTYQSFVSHEAVPATHQPIGVLFSSGYAVRTVTLWITYFMGLVVIYLSTGWLPTMIKDAGMPIERAAMVTAMFQLGGTIGAVLVGLAMDRFNANRIIATAYLVGGISLVVLAANGVGSQLLTPLVFAVGFFLSGAQTGLNAHAPGCYPTMARATGVSWMLGMGRLGSILGSSIGGFLLAWGWGFDRIFMFLAVPATIAALSILANAAATKRGEH